MLRPLRRDGELERLRRRHLPAVYRYAVLVLPCEADALAVTRAAFDRAGERMNGHACPVPTRRWLLDTTHELARSHAAQDGDGCGDERSLDAGECTEVERVLSRRLDGGLARADRRRLHAHLARCGDCRSRERSYLAVQRAFRALAASPVQPGLAGDDGDRFTCSAPGGSLGSEERRPVGIVNRRNAVIGWAAWQVGKRVARQKAKNAVPSVDSESKRPNKPALAAAVAAVVGGLVFWKRQRGGESTEPTE